MKKLIKCSLASLFIFLIIQTLSVPCSANVINTTDIVTNSVKINNNFIIDINKSTEKIQPEYINSDLILNCIADSALVKYNFNDIIINNSQLLSIKEQKDKARAQLEEQLRIQREQEEIKRQQELAAQQELINQQQIEESIPQLESQQPIIPNWCIGTSNAGWQGFTACSNYDLVQSLINTGIIIAYPTGDVNYGSTKWFAGHNPGIMSYLSWIDIGSVITLSGENTIKNYQIVDVKYYPPGTKTNEVWFNGCSVDFLSMINGAGPDSIIVQFCRNGACCFCFGLPC